MSKDRGFNMHIIYKWLIVILLCGIETSVFAQVTAKFSSSKITSCGNTEIEFIDESTGSPTEWIWDFGNGVKRTESESKSYKFIYQPGTYTVSLKVSRGTQTDETSLQITINPLPNPDFEIKSFDGCTHSDVTFSDKTTSDSEIEKYLWAFGDGGSSMSANPLHSYAESGFYTVALTVTDAKGCRATISKDSSVQVTEPLNISFDAEETEACEAPLITTFQSTTHNGDVAEFLWNFGDGETSTEEHPSHTFINDGFYDIALTVKTSTGCATTKKVEKYVKINTFEADIISADYACQNLDFAVDCNANSPMISWSWNFGNGDVSTDKKTNIQFVNKQNYEISLKAVNHIGCESITQKIIPVLSPEIVFEADKTTFCAIQEGTIVNFSCSNDDFTSYKWGFGDGEYETTAENSISHTYYNDDDYDVSLQVTDNLGCIGTKTLEKYISASQPNVSFAPKSNSYCVRSKIELLNHTTSRLNFTSTWEYLYDESLEASKTETEENVIVSYGTSGLYVIKLNVVDAIGCSGEFVDTLKVGGIYTSELLTPSGKKTQFCKKENVEFVASDKDIDKITKWRFWFTGMNTETEIDTFVTEPKLTLRFDIPDEYDLWLMPYQYSCPGAFASKEIVINPPKSSFSFYPASLCAFPDTIHFDPSSSIGAESYLWDFGDGNSLSVVSTGEDGHYKWIDPSTSVVVKADTTSFTPYHIYQAPNNYNVTLTTYAGTCDDDTTIVLNTSGIKMGFTQDTTHICQGLEIQFVDTSKTSSGSLVKRLWTITDSKNVSSVYETSECSYFLLFEKPGTYNVALEVFSDLGCHNNIQKTGTVTVYEAPTITSFTNVGENSGCSGFKTDFKVQSATAKKYIWFYGDGQSDTTTTAKSPQHAYSLGTYQSSVKVMDSKNCSTKSDSIQVRATYPFPNFQIPANLCYYDSLVPIDYSVGENLTYSWSWGDGTNSTGKNTKHLYSSADKSYSITLRLIDENGCDSSLTLTTRVRNPQADFVASNTDFQCPPAEVSFTDNSFGENLSYNWTFGEYNSTPISVQNAFWQYQNVGKYDVSLAVKDNFNCVDTLVKSNYITIHGPQGKLKVTPETGCTYTDISMTIYDTKDIAKYSWVFGDGQYSNEKTDQITYQYLEGNVYTPSLTIIDENGCEIPLVGNTVTIYGAKPDFSSVQEFCELSPVQISDLSTSYPEEIDSWLWKYQKNGVVENIEGKSFEKTLAPGVYDILLQTKVKDCVYNKNVSQFIKVYETPVVSLTTSDDEICDFTSIDVTANVVSGDDGKGTFEHKNVWSGNGIGGLDGDSYKVTFTANSFENNTIYFDYVSTYGCAAAQASKDITVYAIPNKIDDWTKNYCLNDAASELSNEITTANGTLVWYDSDETVLSSAPVPITSIQGTQQYFVAQSAHGCEGEKAQVLVVVNPLPKPIILIDTTYTCQGSPLVLGLDKKYASQTWSCSPENHLSSSTVSAPIFQASAPAGIYVVGVVVEDANGCRNSIEAKQTISVFPIPEVDFEISKDPIKMMELVEFINTTDTTDMNNIKWLWTINDFTSTEMNLAHSFSDHGTFDITLDGFIYEECKNSVTKPITVLYSARVPNVFTPNGDGVNDVFFEGMPEAELVIINRWGQELYRGYDGWDGTYNGEVMAAGTYFYIITLPNGESYNGPLMLLRN